MSKPAYRHKDWQINEHISIWGDTEKLEGSIGRLRKEGFSIYVSKQQLFSDCKVSMSYKGHTSYGSRAVGMRLARIQKEKA